MNVGTICCKKVFTVQRTDGLLAAAHLMREKHIGYLVVVGPERSDEAARPVGVLTDRDIVVSVVAPEIDPRTLRVGDVMTQPPITVGESDSIEKALAEMRGAGVRRLPIVAADGRLIGILSIDDVLEVLAGDLQDVSRSIRNERMVEGLRRP